MLFLGITGLLIMGVLVGAGTSINIQRYRDSVSSLQSVLQQQFSDVINVSNDSAGDRACYGDSSIRARGQSDCVILGKFITTADGRQLAIKSVIGYIPPAGLSVTTDDINALQQYSAQISPTKEGQCDSK